MFVWQICGSADRCECDCQCGMIELILSVCVCACARVRVCVCVCVIIIYAVLRCGVVVFEISVSGVEALVMVYVEWKRL